MDFTLLATSEFSDMLAICKQYGPFLLLVLFFLYRDYKRELHLTGRIEALETEMRGVILPLVEDCTAVITKNTHVMERLETKFDNH